jgi:hypoxanthine phosphoribosyltransferase
MRVENLIDRNFEAACQNLARQAYERMQPNLVIGIRRGGVWVRDAMKAALPENIVFGEIGLQRSGTAKKNQLNKVLKSLPQWLCNLLRMSEACARRIKHSCCRPKLYPHESLSFDPASEALLQSAPQQIWIVDDAVDSGKSMASIHAKLQTYPQTHKLLYIALTVTEKRPLLMPDVYLYNEGVLLRFPWSNDLKNNSK